ncbi:Golgi-associated plant pathogenesis-related protein 1 [Echinococcus granulosus]|uniref:Golgi associated plant pathogenesis n=1 Tax=Echinococcus granulosus TaxID=6210 RepID=A0A068WZV2_ECHGR|nr:Golgi-associated plant pathogenesis-related protein 1 [Echinococcus granulosus]CDS24051.1 Golgi associated plant pathogenesis [Echinococcus granulosus]
MKVDLTFNKEGIKAHNFLRRLHGCTPLVMGLDLAESAQAYAAVLARENGLRHSGLPDVGENLARLDGSPPMKDISAAQVTLLWYNEIKNYPFVGEDPIRCGHFSQLIWKNTTAVGMGVAESADKTAVTVVAHYRPPGNFRGQWGNNVPRLIHGIPHAFSVEELTKAMNAEPKSVKKEERATPSSPQTSARDTNQLLDKSEDSSLHRTEFPSASPSSKEMCRVQSPKADLPPTLPTQMNEEESAGSASKVEVNFASLKPRQIDEGAVFAMEVFMALNQRRVALGLPPFLLNEDFDHLAQELAKGLKSGDSRDIPEGTWQGRRTRHYSECSCLLHRNATKFVQRCYLTKLRMSVADPNCKYVTIGCELNPPFKRSSIVILFA